MSAFGREPPVALHNASSQLRLETQHWLRSRANDHMLLRDLEAALASFEAALRAGGPRDAVVLEEIEAARAMLQAERRGEPIPQLFGIPLPLPQDATLQER